MYVTKASMNGKECHYCPNGEVERRLDEVKRDRSIPKYAKTKAKKAVLDELIPVATCDKPVKNEWPHVYEECGKRMCAKHIGAEPQRGYHLCLEHA